MDIAGHMLNSKVDIHIDVFKPYITVFYRINAMCDNKLILYRTCTSIEELISHLKRLNADEDMLYLIWYEGVPYD